MEEAAKAAFTKFKLSVPSILQFLDSVAAAKGRWFVRHHRKALTDFYYSQETVQRFTPPPAITSLKKDPIFYPKLVAFFPFERFYCDVAYISYYKSTRAQEKKEAAIAARPVPSVPAPTRERPAAVPNTEVGLPLAEPVTAEELESRIRSLGRNQNAIGRALQAAYRTTRFQPGANHKKLKTTDMLVREILAIERANGKILQ